MLRGSVCLSEEYLVRGSFGCQIVDWTDRIPMHEYSTLELDGQFLFVVGSSFSIPHVSSPSGYTRSLSPYHFLKPLHWLSITSIRFYQHSVPNSRFPLILRPDSSASTALIATSILADLNDVFIIFC